MQYKAATLPQRIHKERVLSDASTFLRGAQGTQRLAYIGPFGQIYNSKIQIYT